MAIHIVPGVYSTIVDLSTYVQQVPSTIGFVAFLSEYGEDNKLKFKSSQEELFKEYGKPNINTYGKSFGQGLYIANNFIVQSGSEYVMRVLPEDATYANLKFYIDSNNLLKLEADTNINSVEEIETRLVDPSKKVIYIIVPIGRGDAYNEFSVNFTPSLTDSEAYVLDVYRKTSDGDDVIAESFTVSFNPTKTDSSGESMFVVDVLKRYSQYLRIYVNESNLSELNTLATETVIDYTDTPPSSPSANDKYLVADGATGDWQNHDGEIATYDGSDWSFDDPTQGMVVKVEATDTRYYYTGDVWQVFEPYSCVYTATSSDNHSYKSLGNGSVGSLLNSDGTVNATVATQILAQAYSGLIDDLVVDKDKVYFNMVWDAGYPTDVKSSIVDLVANLRRDCFGFVDNGDNPTAEAALQKRQNDHKWNTPYAALYEQYTEVYDEFTGRDIWVSPMYHMSTIVPKLDRTGEIWFAPAGLNNAVIDCKRMRYNPKEGHKEQFYLNRINYFVEFNVGICVWQDLTMQFKSSKLENIPVVRMVLYAQRALDRFCKFYIYDQADEITFDSIKSEIVTFLSDLKRRRALKSFDVKVYQTPYDVKTKTIRVDVILEPILPIEKIELTFFIK